MCTIPYQKCVCFVFLVVLAVLSCSGFRIDNLAMTDVSKRTAALAEPAHRLRHRRQMPAAARRRPPCPEFDASWKAYRADAIAVAAVDSRSSRCKSECAVQFKIHRWLKKPPPDDDRLIRLTFRADRANRCDYGDAADKPYFLVRTNSEQSKRYILFLKTDGPHNYTAAFAPELNRTKTFKTVLRVNAPHFKPKRVQLDKISRVESAPNRSKRLKLACKVRGFPIPLIHWQVNNTLLHPSSRIRITQKRKRSTLVIRNFTDADWGQYRCVAKDVDGNSHNVSHTIGRPGKPCTDKMKESYCFNGGTCFFTESMVEYSCVCANGYTGQRCENKLSDQSRY